MTDHGQGHDHHGEGQCPPESVLEVGELGGFVLLRRRHLRFERHAVHCLVLDRAYRYGADGVPVFVEAAATDEQLQAILQTINRAQLMRTGRPHAHADSAAAGSDALLSSRDTAGTHPRP